MESVKNSVNSANSEKYEVKEVKAKEKLWNKSFILLFQGQFISIFGDNVYDTALRFYILASTGSVSLMGILMAVSMLPKVFLSPFAGTFIDRSDRKKVMIVSDLISGGVIVLMGAAAASGLSHIWMLLLASVAVGICSCFFNPALNSSIPDVVPKAKLLKANSALSSISSANDVAGYALGGFLVQLAGAPLLFIFNGFSFLFSAACNCFINIPKVQTSSEKLNFLEDMKSGISFVYKSKGLGYLYVTICFLNFFASMSMTLTLPYFKANSQLGIVFYGIAMAINTLGMFVGFLILSLVELKKDSRFNYFILSGILLSITMILYSLTLNIMLICLLFFIDGMCLALMGSLLQSTLQLAVPSHMRSKVFGFRNTLSSALMPVGMIFAGFLAEKISMNLIILGDYILFLLLFIYLSFLPSVRDIING